MISPGLVRSRPTQTLVHHSKRRAERRINRARKGIPVIECPRTLRPSGLINSTSPVGRECRAAQ